MIKTKKLMYPIVENLLYVDVKTTLKFSKVIYRSEKFGLTPKKNMGKYPPKIVMKDKNTELNFIVKIIKANKIIV